MVARARDQVEGADFVHDAGKQRRLRVEPGDAAGDDLRQRGDMGGVLPQPVGQFAVSCRRRCRQLPADDGAGQRTQIAEAEPQDRRAHVGDRPPGAVADGRVGDGDDLRRQQRFGLHQSRRVVERAVGIVERALEFQRHDGAGREADLAAFDLGGDLLQDFVTFHSPSPGFWRVGWAALSDHRQAAPGRSATAAAPARLRPA